MLVSNIKRVVKANNSGVLFIETSTEKVIYRRIKCSSVKSKIIGSIPICAFEIDRGVILFYTE